MSRQCAGIDNLNVTQRDVTGAKGCSVVCAEQLVGNTATACKYIFEAWHPPDLGGGQYMEPAGNVLAGGWALQASCRPRSCRAM